MKMTFADMKSRALLLVPAVLCATLLLLADARPAAAEISELCMQEAYNVYDQQKLNCTANDVSIVVYQTTGTPLVCEADQPVTAPLQAQLVATASERYDIGMYIALDGGDALIGTCWRDWLLPPLSTTPTPAGQPRYYPFFDAEQTEDPNDTCGDLEQGIYNYRDLGQLTFVCKDLNNDGVADIGACASWDNLKSKGTNNNPSCTTLEQTLPNTPSKCRCEATPIANIYVGGRIVIDKVTDPAGDLTEFDFTLKGGPSAPPDYPVDKTFKLIDTQTPESYLLRPGSYQLAELAEGGWGLSNLACTVTGTNGSTVTYAGATATITLKAKDTVTCTYTNTRTAEDLVVTKTAAPAFARLYKWQIDKSVDDTRIDIAEGGTATFNYTVAVTPDGYTDSSWTVTGQITVANPNDFAISGVTVSDEVSNGGVCTVTGGTDVSVPAGGNVVLGYSCTYAAAPTTAAGNNTATASWDKAAFYTPNGSASGTAAVDFAAATPSETNRVITVVDDKTMGIPVTLGTSDYLVGPFSYTYQLSTQGVPGTCTDYTNTAVIDETDQSDSQKVTVCVGKDLTVAKTATPTFTRTWDWTIVKEADATYDLFAGATQQHGYKVSVTPTTTDSDWKVEGTITVTNPNDWQDITLTGLADAVDNGGVCTVAAGPYVVPKGGSINVAYSCTYASLTAAAATNTATASWDKAATFTPAATAAGTAGFAFDKPTTEVNPTVTVDDDNLTGENWSADRAAAEWSYSKDFTCSTDASNYTNGKYAYSHINTAIINGFSDKSDTATVEVSCYAPVVSKDVSTYFNRDWDWTITKDYDKSYDVFAGDKVTHDYKVTVTPTYSDNGWGAKGNITVTNAHPTQGMTLTSVSDLAGGISGVVTCPSLVVPAAGSLTCTYDTGPQASPNVNPFGATNTATAVFAAANWTGTAPIVFGATPTTESEPVITVDDDNLTGESWRADRAYAEWTYTKEFACSGNPAEYTNGKYVYSHTNTAKINEISDKSETAKVDVSCYAPVVGKTADTYFNRDWDWTITKDYDKSYDVFAGDAVTHSYKVTVTPTSVDNDWGVKGTITIANNHPTQAMTLTSVSDLAGGISGVVTCPSLVVPAAGSLTCSYDTGPQASPNVNPFGSTNTATAVFAAANWTGTAAIVFGTAPTTESDPAITVDDDNLTGETWSADRASAQWSYTREFACSSNPADYSNGRYTYSHTNTALIVGMAGKSDSARVDVGCYAPVVSKTAAGTYDERHEWDVEKTVSPETQNAFAGDTISYQWKVVVTEQTFEENSRVAGIITVQNPAPVEMTVSLVDVLGGGTAATITADADCSYAAGTLTIPANSTSTCNYSAAPADRTDTVNNATATLNGIPFSAAATFGWAANVIRDSATVTDSQTGLNQQVTEGGTFTFSEQYSCSGAAGDYAGDGTYTFSEDNTAIVSAGGSEEDRDTATTSINCYAPVVSKTAAGTYDERHDWDVQKTVNPSAQSGFAGDTLPFTWTIVVTETTADENFAVTGTITVQNPAPATMTVALADVLSDSTAAVIGSCSNGGAYTAGSLTIPAGTTTVCSYSAAPASRAATVNTATATLNGIAFTAADPIEWAANVLRAEAVLTDLQGPLNETITGSGTWTIEDRYACSTDTSKYTANYGYNQTIFNTAKLTSGSYEKSSTTSTAIACYIPEISKTAAGTYTERHDWEVTKTASPAAQSAFAGDTVAYQWTVAATERVAEGSFVASGKITVVNHNPEDALTVALSDVLGDGKAATISACTGDADLADGLTIAAGGTSACDYSAALTYSKLGDAPTNNTATAVLNGLSYSASDPIEWTAQVINASVALDDDQNPGFPLTVTDGGTWTYAEQYTCSTDKALYAGDQTYTFTESNTATLKNGGTTLASATASTAVDCYVPSVSKTAAGSYDAVRDWTVTKTVNSASQTAFAGEKKSFTWTVTVDESSRGENYAVSGTITIANPNPEDALTVSLSDMLSDGTPATIGPCTGGTLGGGSLTVPAGGSATCSYTATPTPLAAENKPTNNTATATLNGIAFPASAGIAWTANAINPTATLDDDQKPDWPITVSADTTFTYEDPQGYTCSTDPAAYTNGFYQYNEANTAVLTYTTGSTTASASTAVKCYAPVVAKTAAGTYNERHDWDVEKTVDKTSQNAFAGDTVSYEWTVTVQETVTEEGFVASGTVSVKNPRPDDGNMVVHLSDVLSDGFVATITGCTGGTWNGTNQTVAVPPASTAVCSYTASLSYTDDAEVPNRNTVTATFNGFTTTASDALEWTTNVIRGSATLDDDQNPAFPLTISDGGTWKYSENYTCSTDKGTYDSTTFRYAFGENNIAIVSSGGSEQDRDDAATEVTCYWPQIELVKTGDELSKISDKVYYDFTLTNNTPVAAGLRALSCTISDSLIGFSKTVTLASGASDTTLDREFTIPGGASDPFVNEASASCKPTGSTFSASTTGTWSTNLFQPAVTIDKSGPAQAYPGSTIQYTFTITNTSSSDSPNLVLASISDDKLGDLMSLATAAGCGNLAPGATCSFTKDKSFAIEFTVPYEVKNTVTVLYHPAGFPNDIRDSDNHTVVVTPPILVTNSSLCTFDVDPTTDGRQFRRIFTPDPQSMPNYKLNATNPGQFFYNLALTGTPGEQVDITLDIPWAFVTQGNMPVHVYDGVSLSPQNGQVCFLPGNEMQAIGAYIVLDDYAAGYTDPQTTVPVQFTITIPPTGFAYVNQHLDDGLKGPQVDVDGDGVPERYGKDGSSNAVKPGTTEIVIPNLFEHVFSVAADGTQLGSDTVQNLNEFKKNPGTGGQGLKQLSEDPVPGLKVRLLNPAKAVVGTGVTDQDGWYMIPYKHTGRLATYKLQVDTNRNGAWNDSGDLLLDVPLKANAYAERNFQLP